MSSQFLCIMLGLLSCSSLLLSLNVVESQITGSSTIIVDGDTSDWSGITPIVNDTGDRSFWVRRDSSTVLYGYDITDCYVTVDDVFFYFLFFKKPSGSASWQVYFDVDFLSQTGYLINGMGADYRFIEGMGHGLEKWSEGVWIALNYSKIAPNPMNDGFKPQVAAAFGNSGFYWNQSTEWLEGKIALAALGNPSAFRLVFQVLPEQDIAPETGFVVVEVTQDCKFATSFISNMSAIRYGELANLTYSIVNLGVSNIESINLQITLPASLRLISGSTTWHGEVLVGNRLAVSTLVDALDFGKFTIQSDFSWSVLTFGNIKRFTSPLSLVVAPRIALEVEAPEKLTLGMEYFMNITVVNQDSLWAPAYIEPEPWSSLIIQNISLRLAPNAGVQLDVNFIATSLGRPLLGIQATFEKLVLDSKELNAEVVKPMISIVDLNITRQMVEGEVYPAEFTIENLENVSYTVEASLSLHPDKVDYVDGQSRTVILSPKTNSTVTFMIKPREQGYFEARISLRKYEVNIAEEQVYPIQVEARPLLSPQMYIIIASVLILVGILLWKNKAIFRTLRRTKEQHAALTRVLVWTRGI